VCARPVACESIRSVSPYTRLFRSRRQFGGSLGGLFLFPAFVGKHLVQKTERLVGGRQRLARRPVGFRGLLEDPVPLARILLVLLMLPGWARDASCRVDTPLFAFVDLTGQPLQPTLVGFDILGGRPQCFRYRFDLVTIIVHLLVHLLGVTRGGILGLTSPDAVVLERVAHVLFEFSQYLVE